MTNFIQTRSYDQRNGQGGFAIGLILLVVLLIAVIVGAIAVASRSTTSGGNTERDRVISASMINQMQTINNGFVRATQGGGYRGSEVYLGYGVDSGNTQAPLIRNDPANLIGANGYFSAPQINATAYSGTCPGSPLQGTTVTSANCVFWLSRINLGNPNGESAIVYTKPVLETVGKQINTVLWGTAVSAALPSLGGTAITGEITASWGQNNPIATGGTATDPLAGGPTRVTGVLASAFPTSTGTSTLWSGVASGSTGVAGSNLPQIGTTPTQRPEGVFQQTATSNVYYRVLDNL